MITGSVKAAAHDANGRDGNQAGFRWGGGNRYLASRVSPAIQLARAGARLRQAAAGTECRWSGVALAEEVPAGSDEDDGPDRRDQELRPR